MVNYYVKNLCANINIVYYQQKFIFMHFNLRVLMISILYLWIGSFTSIVLFDTDQRINALYFACLVGDHLVGQNMWEVIVYVNWFQYICVHLSVLLLCVTAVAQWVEAPRYKPEGGSLRSRRLTLEFFIDIILPAALWPWGWHNL